MNNYELGKEIGKGAHGTIYVAKDIKNNREVAVKQHPHYRKPYINAGEILRELKDLSPFILQYIDFIIDKVPILITEYLPWNNIYQHINDYDIYDLSIEDAINIFLDLSKAIKILHDRDIIHNDIKPDNILLDTKTKQIKIIDFDMAWKVMDLYNPYGGTIGYTDPLLLDKQSIDKSIKHRDIYSLGVVFGDIITCECLKTDYSNDMDFCERINYMHDKVVDRDFSFVIECTDQIQYSIIELISNMISLDISKRPDIDSVIMSLEAIKNNL